jgi:hypothetical protein
VVQGLHHVLIRRRRLGRFDGRAFLRKRFDLIRPAVNGQVIQFRVFGRVQGVLNPLAKLLCSAIGCEVAKEAGFGVDLVAHDDVLLFRCRVLALGARLS